MNGEQYPQVPGCDVMDRLRHNKSLLEQVADRALRGALARVDEEIRIHGKWALPYPEQAEVNDDKTDAKPSGTATPFGPVGSNRPSRRRKRKVNAQAQERFRLLDRYDELQERLKLYGSAILQHTTEHETGICEETTLDPQLLEDPLGDDESITPWSDEAPGQVPQPRPPMQT